MGPRDRPLWTTDNSNIATIDNTGQLLALNNGNVTILAAYQGVIGRLLVGVVANYGGLWRGDSYTQLACDHSGAFVGWCYEDVATVHERIELGVVRTETKSARL
jgi:hypothetical protein